MRTRTRRSGSAELCSSSARWMPIAQRTASSRGREGEQESVPEELPLLAAVLPELIPQDLRVGPEDLVGDRIPALQPEGGRALDVGHHDRERLDQAADVGHGLPLLRGDSPSE